MDELSQLKEQVAALTDEVSQLRRLIAGPAPSVAANGGRTDEGSVTRRAAIATLAGAALGAGVVGVASVLQPTPAAATTGTMVYGTLMIANSDRTALTGGNPKYVFVAENGAAPDGTSYAAGVTGQSPQGCGVEGTGGTGIPPQTRIFGGVIGRSRDRLGVIGLSATNVGVYGQSDTGTAVQSFAKQGTGMYGVSVGGSGGGALGGVVGDSDTNAGVVGFTKAAARAAGEFIHTGAGRAATFKGSKAQVQLIPTSAATHPASGLAGDLYVDNAKRLWFCKGATAWVQLG